MTTAPVTVPLISAISTKPSLPGEIKTAVDTEASPESAAVLRLEAKLRKLSLEGAAYRSALEENAWVLRRLANKNEPGRIQMARLQAEHTELILKGKELGMPLLNELRALRAKAKRSLI